MRRRLVQICAHLRQFREDCTGYVTMLMMVLFTGVLLLTGVAIDLLKHEAERSDLQAALDRGVLAATTLSQTGDINEVITSYVRNGLPFGDSVEISIFPTINDNERSIRVFARYSSSSIFLGMIGMNNLLVPASATAIQSRQEIEISLVLDRSGSMGGRNKINRLREAATEFVNIIEDNYGSDDLATINLVPYAGSVANIAPVAGLFEAVDPVYVQNCLSFPQTAFQSTDLDKTGTYRAPYDFWTCPSANPVLFMANDYGRLRSEISRLQAGGTTGTYTAVKWGLGLLSPSLRTDRVFNDPDLNDAPVTFTEFLMARGLMPAQHSDRPSPWDRDDSLKVMVVMTDGYIVPPWRIGIGREVTTNEGVARFLELCRLARENGVRVFTVAFETFGAAVDQMRGCASSENDFFNVDGTDLVAAFKEIAQNLSKLKLTQ